MSRFPAQPFDDAPACLDEGPSGVDVRFHHRVVSAPTRMSTLAASTGVTSTGRHTSRHRWYGGISTAQPSKADLLSRNLTRIPSAVAVWWGSNGTISLR